MKRQALLCHRVLRTIESVARESAILTRDTWETLLKFLLAANDSLLSPPTEKGLNQIIRACWVINFVFVYVYIELWFWIALNKLFLTALKNKIYYKWARLMTKPAKWLCAKRRSEQPGHPRSLIRASLSAWRKLGFLATYWAHSEDSDQTSGCPGWSESSLGAQSFCWFCHEAAQILLK